jgi:hypothetical protein
MNKRTIIWRVLWAVSLAFGCGSKTVVDTSTSSGAGGEGASTSAGGSGAGPFSCGDGSDCSPEDACRFKISETCDGAAPQCVSKTKNSLCEDGQEWDDPARPPRAYARTASPPKTPSTSNAALARIRSPYGLAPAACHRSGVTSLEPRECCRAASWRLSRCARRRGARHARRPWRARAWWSRLHEACFISLSKKGGWCRVSTLDAEGLAADVCASAPDAEGLASDVRASARPARGLAPEELEKLLATKKVSSRELASLPGVLPYSCLVHTRSNLQLRASAPRLTSSAKPWTRREPRLARGERAARGARRDAALAPPPASDVRP